MYYLLDYDPFAKPKPLEKESTMPPRGRGKGKTGVRKVKVARRTLADAREERLRPFARDHPEEDDDR